ncbi:MAG: hypothetical protein KJ052_11700, partial [Candidatus Hydrogenedentes bacterium]|nr:hypothetical protein [Candidatus Hydrogenedentota bacterium]
VVMCSVLCLTVSGTASAESAARTADSAAKTVSRPVSEQEVLDVLLEWGLPSWTEHKIKAEKLSSMGTDAAVLAAELLLSGQLSYIKVLPVLRELRAPETVPILLEYLKKQTDNDARYEVLQLLVVFGGPSAVATAQALADDESASQAVRLAVSRICLRYGGQSEEREARARIQETWMKCRNSLRHYAFPYTLKALDSNQVILSAWDLQEPAIQHDILEWLDEQEELTWNDFGVLHELYDPSIERFKPILLKSIASDAFIGNYPTLVPDAIKMLLDGFPEVQESEELMAHLRERYMANIRAYKWSFEDPETAYPELYKALFPATQADR